MSALRDFYTFYSRDALLTIGFFATVGAVVAGFLADRVMRERGFGPIGNGILILMGVGVGLIISRMELGPLRSSESDRVVIMAAAASTTVLLLCGAVKSILLDET